MLVTRHKIGGGSRRLSHRIFGKGKEQNALEERMLVSNLMRSVLKTYVLGAAAAVAVVVVVVVAVVVAAAAAKGCHLRKLPHGAGTPQAA